MHTGARYDTETIGDHVRVQLGTVVLTLTRAQPAVVDASS